MPKIAIIRTDKQLPANLDAARELLFGALDGFTQDDKRSWRRFWARLVKMEPGEMANCEMRFPRSGPFHRRHMAIEQQVFDSQERFEHFLAFRDWLKIGAGHVEWHPGPRGGVVPVPNSIDYASLDDEEFRVFHHNAVAFLRTEHAAKALWPHLKDPAKRMEMIEAILGGFDE